MWSRHMSKNSFEATQSFRQHGAPPRGPILMLKMHVYDAQSYELEYQHAPVRHHMVADSKAQISISTGGPPFYHPVEQSVTLCRVVT